MSGRTFSDAPSDSRRRSHRRRGRTLAVPAVLVALMAGAFAAPAQANHAPVGKATFPGTNFRCSSGQDTFLRAAWQEGYAYTVRAKALVDHIAAQPSEDERRRLWEQDFRGYGSGSDTRETASPQRYFGAYGAERLAAVRRALGVARGRFEGDTMDHITCSTVCAQKKKYSANHIVKGRIVTCSLFWSAANRQDVPYARRLRGSADTLLHELLHHVAVKVGIWRAVGDYHGDGIGGHPDGTYYGLADVTYLARNAPNWAVRNNDSYAFFATNLSGLTPIERFTGVYTAKESAGTGGLYRDLTWAQLKAKKTEQAALGQYLADVETYVRGKQRLYAGLWRIGARDGLLTQDGEAPFRAQRKALERGEDLIDVEVFREDGAWRFIGVYRKRAADAKGVGALQVDLSWNTLFARQGEYAKLGAYLADVETYVEGGKRKYLGMWLVGPGAGAMANTSDAAEFTKILDNRRGSQQLIDIERYVQDGVVYQLGVWRYAASGHGYAREPWTAFVTRWLSTAADYTLIDIEEDANVPLEY